MGRCRTLGYPSMSDDQNPLRSLPSVDAVVRAMLDGPDANDPRRSRDEVEGVGALSGLAVAFAREAVEGARDAARGGSPVPGVDALAARARMLYAEAVRPSLRPAINASGVLLQTNLGRAPLSERAVAAMQAVAGGYSNLEFDLATGQRGSRHEHGRALLRRVTGAADGMVVNNNAAALFFVLHVLAEGRRVLVSRGEAVEIGGGFRIPDVVAESGCLVTEVGTTNRTYARDYAAAIERAHTEGPAVGALLRVHSSNFRVVGFTARPALEELVALVRERAVPLVDDVGSGALIATEAFGMAHEPMVQESVAAGADLVLFSGDKLLGGPQAGIIVGREDIIERLRRHPLARALRVDKLTSAALLATLIAYAGGTAMEEIPIWRMASAPLERVRARAARWVAAAGSGACVAATTMVGGGSLPGEGVPTWVAAIPAADGADHLAAALRQWRTPVVARIEDGCLRLDPRSVIERDDDEVAEALASLVPGEGGGRP